MSMIAASGAYTAGSINSAYVIVFGSYAYIQDATSGIYACQASKTGNPLKGLTVGAQVSGLRGGGFEFYFNYGQFEYASIGATVLLTATSTSPGTGYQSIPASYTSLTLATFNSALAKVA